MEHIKILYTMQYRIVKQIRVISLYFTRNGMN